MLSPTAGRSRHHKLRLPLAVLASCVAAMAVSAPGAVAAPGSGSVKLTLGGSGKAAKALADQGVKTSAVAPARKSGKRVTLPVQNVTVGKAATISLRGGIGFKAGKRKLKLKSVKLKLTAAKATVTAKSGRASVPVFTAKLAKGKAKLDRAGTTAKLAGATLALTPRGAKLLRTKLAVSDVAAGALGKLAVDAKPKSGPGPTAPGGPVGGGPTAGPIKKEPPLLARPAGAVDVTTASLDWRPRASWICYVAETSVFGGAANGPTETLACPTGPPRDLVATFKGFPFKSGWYDPATGTAAIYFNGGVGFRYPAHGINFSSANPEIEINGPASRAIFTFNGTEGTKYDNQRGVLVDLKPNPIQTPPGGTITYTDIPATVPADAGASVFAGFYGANEPFGSLTVSFTTPNP